MDFYLQSDGENPVIHTAVLSGYSLRADPIKADSWIAPKKAFGFDLTATQERLLRGEAVPPHEAAV